MRNTWTDAERDFIRENANDLTDMELKKALNKRFGTYRKHAAVRKERQRLGITKGQGRGRCHVVEIKEDVRQQAKK